MIRLVRDAELVLVRDLREQETTGSGPDLNLEECEHPNHTCITPPSLETPRNINLFPACFFDIRDRFRDYGIRFYRDWESSVIFISDRFFKQSTIDSIESNLPSVANIYDPSNTNGFAVWRTIFVQLPGCAENATTSICTNANSCGSC